jgi:hypothetical protein
MSFNDGVRTIDFKPGDELWFLTPGTVSMKLGILEKYNCNSELCEDGSLQVVLDVFIKGWPSSIPLTHVHKTKEDLKAFADTYLEDSYEDLR